MNILTIKIYDDDGDVVGHYTVDGLYEELIMLLNLKHVLEGDDRRY